MGSVTVNQAEVEALKLRLANLYYAVNVRSILTIIRLEAPIDTGRLRRSHEIDTPRRDGRGFYLRVRARTPYAEIVYRGRAPAQQAFRVRPGRVVTIRPTKGRRSNPWFARGFVRLGFRDVRNFG